MSDATSGSDPVDHLVEEFLERHRRGERPSLTEYIEKYPDLAQRIRTLFPALLVMEEVGSHGGRWSATASRATRASQRRCPIAWAITFCCAPSVPAAWGSSTRRFKNPWAGTWRSKYFRSITSGTRTGWSGSGARPAPRPGCTTPTSFRSTGSASMTGLISTPCSSSEGTDWTPFSTKSSGCASIRAPRFGRRTRRPPINSTTLAMGLCPVVSRLRASFPERRGAVERHRID